MGRERDVSIAKSFSQELTKTFFGILGSFYFWGALFLGISYLISGIPLMKNYSYENAKILLKVSILYLPVLFLTIIIDQLL